MTEPSAASFRGNPPNRDELSALLKGRLGAWNAIRETVVDIGAAWKWVHSENTAAWTYRSYLEGDRFFAALTMVDGGFEVSLNLKADEWDALQGLSADQAARVEQLRAAAMAAGDDPAWVHLAVPDEASLSLAVKLLVARASRKQPPRRKPARKR